MPVTTAGICSTTTSARHLDPEEPDPERRQLGILSSGARMYPQAQSAIVHLETGKTGRDAR